MNKMNKSIVIGSCFNILGIILLGYSINTINIIGYFIGGFCVTFGLNLFIDGKIEEK